MPYYSIDDQRFWEETTPPELTHLQEAGLASGFGVTALPLGDHVAGNPPMVVFLRFAPGGVLIRHAHDCQRIEVLVSGTLSTPDGTVLRPGSVMTSGPGEFYGPHTAGAEGAVTAEIFSATYARIDYDLASAADQPEALAALTKLAGQMDAARSGVAG